ncbi:MAG: T9SS type A sorting domain-containing protein [Candidatus Zixiibacteriota bacterium]
MQMKNSGYCKRLLAGSCLALCALMAPVSGHSFSGRVTVGQPTGSPGETIAVPVYLGGNDVAFTGLRIPLRFDSPDLIADSVSVAGTILDPEMEFFVNIDQDSMYFGVTVIPPFNSPVIPEVTDDSGLLATFWFTLIPSAGEQIINIDSLDTVDTALLPTPTLIFRRLEFVTDSLGISVSVTPGFTPGHISIIATDVGDPDNVLLPREFILNQNYPNPFNPTTTIGFSLPTRSDITLQVFNLLGQSVELVHMGELPAGEHKFNWDASEYPSGVYFYQLKSSHGIQTRKMILVK